MHRTEGANFVVSGGKNQFTNGPPGTTIEKNFLNAVQEEVATVIENAGITLRVASTESNDQLAAALLLTKTKQSRITKAHWHTTNGHGSSNTKIQKFTTELVASDDVVVTVVNSATLGFTVTANMACKLHISYVTEFATDSWAGLSKNSVGLTAVISGLTVNERVALNFIPANQGKTTSVHLVLATNDVIRPHTDAAAAPSVPAHGLIIILAEEIL